MYRSFFFQVVSLVVTYCFWILRDGRIKLFGKDQTQALLVSEEASTSKFTEVLLTYIIYVFSLHNNNGRYWDIAHLDYNDIAWHITFDSPVCSEPRTSSQCEFQKPDWSKAFSWITQSSTIVAFEFWSEI